MFIDSIFATTVNRITEHPGVTLGMAVEAAKDRSRKLQKDVYVIKDGPSFSQCDPARYAEQGFTMAIMATVRPDGTVKRGNRNINAR